MSVKRDLKRFFNPKSIVVFGGGWAQNVIQQLQKSGYQGEIWPVHPKREEILGITCYADVASLPAAPDASFIGVNREISYNVVKDLSNAGAGGAVCFASGFREAEINSIDTEDDRQAQLVEVAGDMPLLGPNCYGYINYLDNVTLWPDQHGGKTCEKGVAIIAQSSNIAINMTMQKRSLNISHMIALGNQAQIGVSEIVEELLNDDRVSAIGLYLEGFNDIRAFEKMAEHAWQCGKQIVVLKVGKSLKAQIAAVTHTASLAGNAASSKAFLKRLGIIVVDSIAVFLETLKLFDIIGSLNGPRIASVSCSGGEASLMSDLTMHTRFEFPDFSEQQSNELANLLGEKVTIANPLDYHTYIWGDVPIMTATFTAVMKENLDLVVFILDIPRSDVCDIESFNCAIDSIIAAKLATGATVAVLGSLSENLDEVISQRFLDAGILPLHGMEEGIKAIDKGIVAGQLKKAPPHFYEIFNDKEGKIHPSGRRRDTPTLSRLSLGLPVFLSADDNDRAEAVSMNEYCAKNELKAFGLTIPKSSFVTDKDKLLGISESYEYPIVFKGLGIEHKTESNAVFVGIDSDKSFQQAIDKMPECEQGYLVEEMAEKPIAELIIGVTKDQTGMFLLTIGAGGIYTEILADSVSLLLPSDRDEILAAIKKLKIYKILAGYRGQAAANMDAIIDAIMSVSDYVENNQASLIELDINPLFAGTESAIAVDALIIHTQNSRNKV